MLGKSFWEPKILHTLDWSTPWLTWLSRQFDYQDSLSCIFWLGLKHWWSDVRQCPRPAFGLWQNVEDSSSLHLSRFGAALTMTFRFALLCSKLAVCSVWWDIHACNNPPLHSLVHTTLAGSFLCWLRHACDIMAWRVPLPEYSSPIAELSSRQPSAPLPPAH